MEYWDLYDADRCQLNKVHVRGNAIEEQQYHIVVGAWIINSKGQILLTLRHHSKQNYPNLWENTGGSVLAGESSIQGIIRELSEEVGIAAAESELSLLGTIRGSHNFVDEYLLKKDIEISELRLQEEEVMDARWVELDELIRMMKNGEVALPIQERFWPFYEKISRELCVGTALVPRVGT
ncbi:NUDIX hydrolase [Anaerobium acetethylicum]|uniref:8-oxo-dGTP diphosphatase n=1 Tax=Anaerobium acetethylicum TaxID=1619234 RepID=A0A1D3TUC0_9FIRM|nr:NUDIX domain-containing protein [Anaerobium acetethylicum]SCP97647.1 mutator mutT protein [Anaerobium acetethylicum]